MPGERRKVYPTAVTTSAVRSSSAIARASSNDPASGFSHSTCLPAATSASAIGRCSALPTTMLTASIVGSSTTASQLGSAFSYP